MRRIQREKCSTKRANHHFWEMCCFFSSEKKKKMWRQEASICDDDSIIPDRVIKIKMKNMKSKHHFIHAENSIQFWLLQSVVFMHCDCATYLLKCLGIILIMQFILLLHFYSNRTIVTAIGWEKKQQQNNECVCVFECR